MTIYHLRITTPNDHEWVETMIASFSSKYIVGKEEGHYHVVYHDTPRKEVKAIMNSHGLKGNQAFSITEARNPTELVKYVCKEGDVLYKGYSPLDIKTFKDLSYRKGGLADEIKELEERYIRELDHRQFGTKYIELLVAYDKNLYPHQIKAYLNKMYIKKNKMKAAVFYDELFPERMY